MKSVAPASAGTLQQGELHNQLLATQKEIEQTKAKIEAVEAEIKQRDAQIAATKAEWKQTSDKDEKILYFNEIQRMGADIQRMGADIASLRQKEHDLRGMLSKFQDRLILLQPRQERQQVVPEKLLAEWLATPIFTTNGACMSLQSSNGLHSTVPFSFRSDRLFVRDCYYDIAQILFDIFYTSDSQRVLLNGNPGIGKSRFFHYLLPILRQKGKTVIYDSIHEKMTLFHGDKVTMLNNLDEAFSLMNSPDTWVIFDGKTPTGYYESYDAKALLICSNKRSHWWEFFKHGKARRLFMPEWSESELQVARELSYPHVTADQVKELFGQWGGIPRYVLEDATMTDQQKLLSDAIAQAEFDKVFKSIGEIEANDDVSHRLVHIRLPFYEAQSMETKDDDVRDNNANIDDNNDHNVDDDDKKKNANANVNEFGDFPPSRPALLFERTPQAASSRRECYVDYVVGWASRYVADRVFQRFEANEHDKLRRWINSATDPVVGALRGVMFEQMAHTMLRTSSTPFRCRQLGVKMEGGRKQVPMYDVYEAKLLGGSNQQLFVFSSVSDTKDKLGVYCRPKSKNQGAFDSVYPPQDIFQMTVSESHGILMSELEEYAKLWAENQAFRFYFVVPEDKFANFIQEQNYLQLKGKVQQNFTQYQKDLKNRITQYALCLKLV